MSVRTNAELEVWVHQIADLVKAGKNIEDSRVELKAAWPTEHQKIARRIAGHANAAGGEPILWIIGLDEKSKSVTGASGADLENWWPQVKSYFPNQFAPELLKDLAVPVDNTSVVALLMATDRAPYLVKNPAGGAIDAEVPWREGTSVRTARREDLLRILVPVSRLPVIEVISGFSRHQTGVNGDENWLHYLNFYVTPVGGPVTIPIHLCDFSAVRAFESHWERQAITVLTFNHHEAPPLPGIGIQQLRFTEPNTLLLKGTTQCESGQGTKEGSFQILVSFGVIEAAKQKVKLAIPLIPEKHIQWNDWNWIVDPSYEHFVGHDGFK